jgi:glycosyltransferase involved in cell wall biosynthesis
LLGRVKKDSGELNSRILHTNWAGKHLKFGRGQSRGGSRPQILDSIIVGRRAALHSFKSERLLRRATMRDSTQILISIIIVVFQNRDELQQILESVLRNKSGSAEIVVIDGGSDDGTIDMLRAYGSAIDYWVSEPDEGIYDAMNKGIAASRGRFIYHINAGDRLLYLPISELLESDAEAYDVVSFSVCVDGRSVFHPVAGWRLRINNTLHHQGTFYRRSKFPGYNVTFRVFADFDANQRLALRGARIKLWDKVVALYSSGGASSQRDAAAELYRVVAANYGNGYVPLTWLDCKFKGLRRRWERLSLRR